MSDHPVPFFVPKRAHALYQKHQRWVPILFFGLGFVFDTLMLQRIDELKTIIQQAVYLAVSALLIRVELIEETHEVPPPFILKKIWKHREALLHFLLGTLLNSYTIFYFKSASAITSFVFIIILIGLLMLNEFKRFGESQTQVHVAFWSLCLISWMVSLAPIVLGFIGALSFLVATAASLAVFYGYYCWLRPKFSEDPMLLKREVLLPYAAMQTLFFVLYFAHAIPPVPLSVKYMGIFHEVEHGPNNDYTLSYSRPFWKFWQHGDQTFLARPGDVVFCYFQVFSPARFKEELQIRWLYQDPKRGWVPADAIPINTSGGREEGYRGLTKKTNFQPGEWRVQIETSDDREIGRIRFTIENDPSTDPREMTVISR